VNAVVIGSDQENEVVKTFGPDRLFAVSYADDVQSRDAWIDTLAGLIQELKPQYVLASATSRGKDLIPGVAARFGLSVIQDISDVVISDGRLMLKRPIYAGKAFETVTSSKDP